MKYIQIGSVVACFLENQTKPFFISSEHLSKVATLDVSRIRIHTRENKEHVVYLDEVKGKEVRLSRILMDCDTERYMAVLFANGNTLDLRKDNLIVEKLGFNKKASFKKQLEEYANTIPPLPEISSQEHSSFEISEEKSLDCAPSSTTPKHGKLLLDPNSDQIHIEIDNHNYVLTKNSFNNSKTLSSMLKDCFGVIL